MFLYHKIPPTVYIPALFYEWLDFIPILVLSSFVLIVPVFLTVKSHFKYTISVIAYRSHISTLLHNIDLPLDDSTFPFALKLYYFSGNPDPL